MTTNEDKEKHSFRRKRNIYAKMLRENREYLPKIKEPKPKYERKKIRPTDIDEFIEEYDDED